VARAGQYVVEEKEEESCNRGQMQHCSLPTAVQCGLTRKVGQLGHF
jgi:hypothetical protein